MIFEVENYTAYSRLYLDQKSTSNWWVNVVWKRLRW